MSEYLGLRTGLRFGGELDLGGLQDGVLLENVLLGLVVSKRLGTEGQKTTSQDPAHSWRPIGGPLHVLISAERESHFADKQLTTYNVG